jgi:hypothetical protein
MTNNHKDLYAGLIPFYESENTVLFNGGCLEVLSFFPENLIDVILPTLPVCYPITALPVKTAEWFP